MAQARINLLNHDHSEDGSDSPQARWKDGKRHSVGADTRQLSIRKLRDHNRTSIFNGFKCRDTCFFIYVGFDCDIDCGKYPAVNVTDSLNCVRGNLGVDGYPIYVLNVNIPRFQGYHNDPLAYKYQVIGIVKGIETLVIHACLREVTLSISL